MNSKQCTSNRMLALNRMTRVRDTNSGLNTQNCCAMSAFYFLLSSQTLKGKKISTRYLNFLFFFWFACSSGKCILFFFFLT